MLKNGTNSRYLQMAITNKRSELEIFFFISVNRNTNSPISIRGCYESYDLLVGIFILYYLYKTHQVLVLNRKCVIFIAEYYNKMVALFVNIINI